MDARTEHEIHKISESVYEDPMKFVKDEFHEEQIDNAKDILRRTKTSDKNDWSFEETQRAEKAAKMVLGRLDGSTYEIDPRKAQELDKKLEVKITQAIRDGRIKPADRREYMSYMNSIKKKR